jgi:predicted acylesterase/phospholipase RssA
MFTDDGRMLVDGGVIENVPLASMKALKSGPNLVVYFNVPPAKPYSVRYESIPNSTLCGVPGEVIKNVKAGHSKASQVAKQVCDVAARGAQPAGPSLSEALGTTPTVPDSSTATKRGAGTFDTLEGSPLAR